VRDGSGRSDFFVFRFDDGQGLGRQDALGQWEVGRFLLEQIRPDPRDFRPKPAGDDWVRRWYRTLIAYQLSQMHFNVMNVERGLELFPDDPEILFLEGVLHETLASPAIQEPMRQSEEIRRSARVRSADGELDVAEDLLRHAVKLDPSFAEGRLHLGHVLGERDQHKAALPELTRALSQIQDQTLQYYGQMFLGRAAAETGDAARARAAFERAAALRPAAQSPLLALSQLAYSRGDSGEAAALFARVAELPALDGDDPWWIYSTTAGRFFAPSHREIAEDLRKEMPR
jgi:tetratricopeptide (TPR) repeat protein